MGSLPEGNLCAYCGVRRAGYIPDGCIGALCMRPNDDDGVEGESCYEVGQRLGWEVVDPSMSAFPIFESYKSQKVGFRLSLDRCIGLISKEVCF